LKKLNKFGEQEEKPKPVEDDPGCTKSNDLITCRTNSYFDLQFYLPKKVHTHMHALMISDLSSGRRQCHIYKIAEDFFKP
jgi:hypothetical protein